MANDTYDDPSPMEYFGSRPYDYEEILYSKPRPTRRLFARYNPSLLQEMNDAIAMNWDCGICSETATDPCVTRCGHLFCQKELLQWFESDASCPRCKIPCSPSTDAMPVFARDWTSPFMPPRSPSPLPPRQDSLTESRQSSIISSRQSEPDDTHTAIYEKASGSPTPTQLSDAHSLLLGRDHPSSSSSSKTATGSTKSVKKSSSMPTLSPVHGDSPYTNLAVSDIAVHYGSIMLRVLGLLILLFALLR